MQLLLRSGIADLEHAMNEVSALLALSHPYIIALEESFVDERANSRTLCIVTEMAEHGDLKTAIQAMKRQGELFSEVCAIREVL